MNFSEEKQFPSTIRTDRLPKRRTLPEIAIQSVSRSPRTAQEQKVKTNKGKAVPVTGRGGP
jgi:hypothetical protein